jgi:hypothetical protein
VTWNEVRESENNGREEAQVIIVDVFLKIDAITVSF